MFTRAIVRTPAENFFEGLTSASLSVPDYRRALQQHQAYCAALEKCGLTLTVLEPDADHPDSTFLEDTAIAITDGRGNLQMVLTRPGAQTRLGEIETMRNVLANFCDSLFSIEAPGTLDGGDICEADWHFFIGISDRTNEAGAQQLAQFVEGFGYTSSFVDIRSTGASAGTSAQDARATIQLLHLKSGLAYLGDRHLVVTQALADRAEFRDYELVRVDMAEEYAANCVRINDYVLVAAGYPKFGSRLRALGYQAIELEMSEFQKMDGGLSCLSLRF